jgi:hypothetical protein
METLSGSAGGKRNRIVGLEQVDVKATRLVGNSIAMSNNVNNGNNNDMRIKKYGGLESGVQRLRSDLGGGSKPRRKLPFR